jgi:hypothetical protein
MPFFVGGLSINGVFVVGVPVLLVVLRIGISRQERANSLMARPPGLAAALCRWMLGLYAEPDKVPTRSGRQLVRQAVIARRVAKP